MEDKLNQLKHDLQEFYGWSDEEYNKYVLGVETGKVEILSKFGIEV